jgi:hypothetical protein
MSTQSTLRPVCPRIRYLRRALRAQRARRGGGAGGAGGAGRRRCYASAQQRAERAEDAEQDVHLRMRISAHQGTKARPSLPSETASSPESTMRVPLEVPPRYSMVPHGTPRYPVVLQGTLWCSMVRQHAPSGRSKAGRPPRRAAHHSTPYRPARYRVARDTASRLGMPHLRGIPRRGGYRVVRDTASRGIPRRCWACRTHSPRGPVRSGQSPG